MLWLWVDSTDEWTVTLGCLCVTTILVTTAPKNPEPKSLLEVIYVNIKLFKIYQWLYSVKFRQKKHFIMVSCFNVAVFWHVVLCWMCNKDIYSTLLWYQWPCSLFGFMCLHHLAPQGGDNSKFPRKQRVKVSFFIVYSPKQSIFVALLNLHIKCDMFISPQGLSKFKCWILSNDILSLFHYISNNWILSCKFLMSFMI